MYPVLTRADAAFSSGDRTYSPLWDGMLVDYYMGRSAMLSIQKNEDARTSARIVRILRLKEGRSGSKPPTALPMKLKGLS